MKIEEAQSLQGATVVDASGQKVGKADEVYLDIDTGQPEWVLVNTGLFGTNSTFVPLKDARQDGGDLQVPYPKDQIKDAPNVEAGRDLSQSEEAELYRYYGFEYSEARSDSGLPEGSAGGGSSDDAMTRSEEQMKVGKHAEETGRVRLRKYVVTDNVTETVPVQREEARVEREPITDANIDDATSGPEISEDEHEVILHEEKPVVQKEAVPVERVRLEKDIVTDEEQVSEELRKEQIDLEGDVEKTR